MGKEANSIKSIIIRYIIIILLGLGNLWLIYKIFSPLTLYISYFLINIIYPAVLQGNNIIYSQHALQIISSCVAGSAYFLLLILNLSTLMTVKTRVKSLTFLVASFLIFNLLRIFIFAVLFANDYASLEALHKFTWYFLSIGFVILLWFINIKIFNIKSVPVYSDFIFLAKKAKRSKKRWILVFWMLKKASSFLT